MMVHYVHKDFIQTQTFDSGGLSHLHIMTHGKEWKIISQGCLQDSQQVIDGGQRPIQIPAAHLIGVIQDKRGRKWRK